MMRLLAAWVVVTTRADVDTAVTMKARERETLLALLQQRFDAHPERHRGLRWATVRERLEADAAGLAAVAAMEATGGEPDVIAFDKKSGAVVFADCAAESPSGRRSGCYDQAALDARREAKPKRAAVEWAAELGIELLDEDGYRALQELGEFDTKTSSWLRTPPELRSLDGALFDLGVSSHQLDTPARGFSFLHDAALDMRMSPDAPQTAADIVNTAGEEELTRIFREFGDEPAARRIASRIVRERARMPIARTLQLAELVAGVIPRKGRTHPATRVFKIGRAHV